MVNVFEGYAMNPTRRVGQSTVFRLIAPIVAVMLASGTAWAAETYSISIPHEVGTFNVLGGKPFVLAPGTERGPGGNALDVARRDQTQIVHYSSGKPLCYDLEGKDKAVTLGKQEGASSLWQLTKVGGRGGSDYVTVQAAEGKLKGWYLDCTEKEEKVEWSGHAITVRRLILAEKPKQIKQFSRYVVSP
jgi:hypothetical protein